MVASLVSWSLPPLPQSHLGGHVTFVRVVYFPPDPSPHTHLHTHMSTCTSYKLASFSVFTYTLRQKTGACGDLSGHTQESAERMPKKAEVGCQGEGEGNP